MSDVVEADDIGEAFLSFLDALAPEPRDIVAIIEAYFDESYDDRLLCVAGYGFKKSKCKEMDRQWRHMLRRKGLPYFRMSACAHHNEPFGHLSRSECDEVSREAIRLIRKYADRGFAVTVDEKEFEALVPIEAQISHGSAYDFCVWNCLMGVRLWLSDMPERVGAAYFFEAGHRHQSSAERLMRRLMNVPELRKEYRYRGHAFVLKEHSRPCQAADLFAWQWFQHAKRAEQGLPPRKDGAALMENRWYQARHIDVKKHVQVVRELMRDHPSMFLPEQSS